MRLIVSIEATSSADLSATRRRSEGFVTLLHKKQTVPAHVLSAPGLSQQHFNGINYKSVLIEAFERDLLEKKHKKTTRSD